MPSGVFTLTSDSVTAAAFATLGSTAIAPAPSDKAPNVRRVTMLFSRYAFRSSS